MTSVPPLQITMASGGLSLLTNHLQVTFPWLLQDWLACLKKEKNLRETHHSVLPIDYKGHYKVYRWVARWDRGVEQGHRTLLLFLPPLRKSHVPNSTECCAPRLCIFMATSSCSAYLSASLAIDDELSLQVVKSEAPESFKPSSR